MDDKVAATNALTVDVEEYFQATVLNIPADQWNDLESRVVPSVVQLLDLFDRHEVKGTFFVVGHVARSHPGLVKELVRRGHEIGSHSGWHQLLSTMDAAQFREDLRTTKALLEDLTGQKIEMFRAPSWSMVASRYEWLSILEEEGFRIDSSIQPFRTVLGGSNRAPVMPFYPIVGDTKLGILEFPQTVWKCGSLRIPFLGGFYLRALPRPIVTGLLKRINRTRPGMIYVHPWEIDPGQPRFSASPQARLIQYYGLRSMEAKLGALLGEFRFGPLGKVAAELAEAGTIPHLEIK